jgi:WD40 repeat protein/serine/threonine protein kinase
MADELCGRTLGEFVLGEKFAEGGCGDLYRCSQPSLKREAVIKVLREGRRGDDEAERRFMREAQLASRLDHHYAAHVYAFGVERQDGLRWIAMELVPGVTLDQWLRSHGPMSLDQFVPLFECIAEVVQAAHTCGIVHRDLKASNVMVIERAGRLIPKLLDFGIAKLSSEDPAPGPTSASEGCFVTNAEPAAGHEVTRTGSGGPELITPPNAGIGSAPYMSPEQWDDPRTAGPASDIYSLGVLAYRALAGRLPFTAQTQHEWRQQHFTAEVPPVGGDLPPALDRIFQRALAKIPAGRPLSTIELASEFRVALMASERAMLRSLAQQWDARARSPSLLLSGDVLTGVERWTRRAPSPVLSDLECSFVAASHRRARRSIWIRRLAGVLVATFVLVAFLNHQVMETRAARRLADAIATQADFEQGRSALLHDEPDAGRHLAAAYLRDHSPSTAFMLARAVQPRLAERARFSSTFERMWSATFSPDGKRVITTDDRNAQVWDAQTYQLLFTLNHGDVVYQAVYSADGAKLVTGCADGAVRVWDPATGVLVRELRREKLKPSYYVIALSPDGKLVAGVDPGGIDPGLAHVWEIDTGRPIAELQDATPSSFPSLSFSSDGRWLAMGTGNDVQVFDTRTWALAHKISGPGILTLSWDPQGAHLATGTADGDASIWTIPSGGRVHRLRELGEPIGAVAFSPDGRRIVAGGRDGSVQVWDASSAKLLSQGNHLRSKVLSVEFDRASSLIAAASSSGSVSVSDAATGMPITMLDGPSAVVRVAHFDPTSQRVVGASWDGTARIWDATAPYLRWSSSTTSASVDACGLITSLKPDGRLLAVACSREPTRVWDTARNLLVAELPSTTPAGNGFAFAYPAVSETGDRAAIASGNNVEIYELPTARLVRTVKHASPVAAIAFASSGRDIVSGALDGSVIVTRDSGALTALPTSTSAEIDAVGFLPDGRVVVADALRHVTLYNSLGASEGHFETRERVATLRMSPDSRHLVTVSSFTGKVVAPELWDVQHYRAVASLDAGGQGPVYSARFLAADQIITGCGDGSFRLWDARTGEFRRKYRGGSRFVVDATLSADRTMLIGGGGDGQLRFWEFSSGRLLWKMQAHRSHLVGVHVDGADIVTRGFSGDITRWSLPNPERVIEACDRDARCAIVTQ